ncbi:hypothetical protein SARC_14549 [Sphaeroforma arctica JP610]|uniref:Phosphatidic acid phosphatase type 2/haloperoxidase domain-containing protein n=1 Tax=Sphaeroforma arctica JP610 TaxID=667725 RepID=A0A0L0F8L2_9EUKA|nr:hypothetical protein SARC_14549 [Sphaeroforma arctica JP610]KNC72891.1 hypothetical protein SARC_14549 [Sphaeroforma arctica JP610]|eukprot:XP_014146793.1 hypothetical protein SARC_14549 [Sphaeroforma arctica JP610]
MQHSYAPPTPGILIGLTRVTDYAHHPWDVVTGWFVGFLFAFLCFPRAAMLQPYLVAGLKRPSGKTQTVATSNPVPGTATAEGPTVFV